jgi:glycosyltransferase involved in cell wall biosynthesis
MATSRDTKSMPCTLPERPPGKSFVSNLYSLHFDLVMLTTVHRATDDRIFHREAKTLVESGLSVCVMGPHDKSGLIDGVWVDALPVQDCRRRRFALGWVVLQKCIRTNSKLFLFHDPELFGVGLILRLLGRHVIYDCHENLDLQVLQKTWIPEWARKSTAATVRITEWLLSRLLSGVIAASPSILCRFPRNRTILVRNFPTTEAMERLAGGVSVDRRADIVIYAGGLSRIRGIKELVEAFRDPQLTNAELWLVGAFDDKNFREEILNSLPPNAKWLGWREHTEVLKLYPQAKAGAVLLYPTPSHRGALPVKLFEYFAAGLPVVASNYPEMISLVGDCGLCVDPKNVKEVRAALVTLFSDPRKTGEMSALARARALDSMSWSREGERLTSLCLRFR